MTAPLPFLVPVTPEARAAALRERIPIDRLPFRVGRECRAGEVAGRTVSLERRKGGIEPNNEVYLLDRCERLHVSREHFQIDRDGDGAYVLVDRGSTCGTVVDDEVVGGRDCGGRHRLQAGSVLKVGTTASPYVFQFVES